MATNAPRCTQGRDCCWVNGVLCSHLNGDRCRLRDELGSWDAVHADARYLESPGAVWRERDIADCGDFVCPNCRSI